MSRCRAGNVADRQCGIAPFPDGRHVVVGSARSLHERLVLGGLSHERARGSRGGSSSPEIVILRGDPVVGRKVVFDEFSGTCGTCGSARTRECGSWRPLRRYVIIASPLVEPAEGVPVREVAVGRGA